MRFHIYLFCFFLSLSAYSQTVKIDAITNSCTGREIGVNFTTTGTLAADNQFSIQVSGYYETVVKTYPLTLKDGRATFIVGANDFPDNALRESFQARIMATKPAMQSDAFTFKINRPVKLSIVGATPAPINPGEPASLFFSYEGTPPIDVVLSDSTRFKLNFSYYSTAGSSSQQLVPATTTTYKIATVSNACGYGSSSGSATIQVNPISLRTAAINMTRVCIGSELRVGYSIQGTLAAGNKFKIRLTAASGAGTSFSEDQTRTYDLDATLDNGFLKATIPANVITQTSYTPIYYSVRVLTSAPAAIGDHAGYTISLFAAPSAEFTSGSRTINLGDTYELGLRMKGSFPFSALLSDGTLAKVDGYEGETLQRLKPTQTTTYTVRSLQTGCGNIPANTSSSVVVTVNPGMVVDSAAAGPVCEGQTVRIRIAHNLTLGSGNAFAVRLRSGSGWTSDLIRAQQQGNYLTFTVPTLPTNNAALDRSQLLSLMVSSSQPIYGTNWVSAFSVPAAPTMTWSTYNTTSLDAPKQSVSWAWTGAGGGPYELELDTGQKSTGNPIGYVNVPAGESRTFRVKTLTNPCYTVQNPSTAALTVKAGADRFIYVTNSYRTTVCRGDSLEITFRTTGAFQPDNKFRVQARSSSSCCDFPATWSQETTGTTIRFRVPSDLGWSSTGSTDMVFRIASTNPVVFSDLLPITIHQPPYNIRFSDAGRTVSLLQPTTVSQEINYLGGTPMTINYSVGGKAYSTTTLSYQWYSQTISYPVTQNTTFTLTSLANACGPVSTSQTIGYNVVPYTLQLPGLYDGYYSTQALCAGSQLSIPYLMIGQPDPAATFSVQVRPSQGKTFQTWPSRAGSSPILVTIPDTLSAGYYTVRLLSNTGIVSNEQSVQVLRSATASLSTQENGSTISLSPLDTPFLKVALTGSPSWTVLFSDGGRTVYTSSPGSYPISPSARTTYQIRAVANACGYGTAGGEVIASIKPTISLRPSAGTSVYCKTGGTTTVSADYSAQGDFEPGNRLFIGYVDDLNSTSVRWLDSTSVLQGTFKINLPQSTSTGPHFLRLMSTKPQLATLMQFVLTAPPSVTLGGNAVVNPGQSTTIRLLAPPDPSSSHMIRYTLATGETGSFYTGSLAIINQNITVQPAQTTTYRVASVSNSCGTGQATGTATVTVNPAADRQVSTGTVQSRSNVATLCAGDTALVSFSTQGVFSSSNRFTVQLSDSTGTRFTDLPTFGTTTTLKALIPVSLSRSSFYRVRVVASDNGSISSTNLVPLSVLYSATASFADAVLPLEVGKTTPVKINLTGDAPWSVRIGNEFNPVSQFTAYTSPYIFNVAPTAALTTYRLYQVSNACGTGQLGTPATVQIMVVTAVETSPAHSFVVSPNPTSGQVRISQDTGGKPYRLYLTDLTGRSILQQSVTSAQHELDLSSLPAGAYIIQLQQGGQQSTHRILKQ